MEGDGVGFEVRVFLQVDATLILVGGDKILFHLWYIDTPILVVLQKLEEKLAVLQQILVRALGFKGL